MNQEMLPVTVTILDKEYRVACREDEREALYTSARYLSNKMKEIRESGKVIGLERIAVMAALNMTHELLQSRAEKDDYIHAVNARMQRLQDKIQDVLERGASLETDG